MDFVILQIINEMLETILNKKRHEKECFIYLPLFYCCHLG